MRDSILSLPALRGLTVTPPTPKRKWAGSEGGGSFTSGHAEIDAYLNGGFKRAQLHEIFATETEDAGSASGFAAMLAMRAQRHARPILWLRSRNADRRGGRFYAAGFAELGGDPADLLLASAEDEITLLRGAVDALRCSGLGAVVIECWGRIPALDLTASRRLTLVAKESGVTALMLRQGAVPSPSTAETRWGVAAAPSVPLAANAPGHAAFNLTLLRRRAGPSGKSWRVEWDRDGRAFRKPASLSGAVVPVPVGGQAGDTERPRISA